MSDRRPDAGTRMSVLYVRLMLVAVVMWGILFTAAGRIDVWAFWIYVGIMLGSAGVIYTILGRRSPELVAERLRPPSDRDRATRRMALPLALGHFVLAGLDARWGWSAIPAPAVVAGLSLVALGFALVGWTLLSNPFASTAVRVQTERAQHVISHGPYAIVRHPMYLAVVFVCLGAGPALASWYAGLVLTPLLAIFVRRTLIEDRMLHAELEGYRAYAGRVRWRVIPFVF